MCDTLVAIGDSTRDGVTIFAKNSDREPNEPQALEFYPRIEHNEEFVNCTYIKVPQVKETYAILISRPIWMWGAEMGANEFGLAIGNEAVFTKEKYLENGLTGMDLVRLALERCKKARDSLELIVSFIKKYGQGGNCGYKSKMFYHNSFIISDPEEAWVLETAGKYWTAEKVKDVRSISNALTIEKEWDISSKELVQHAVEMGWCKDDKDFSFARCYSDKFYTYFSKGRERRKYTQSLLKQKVGEIDLNYVKKIVRSHSLGKAFTPTKGSMKDICMHAGGLTKPSQTTSSFIAQLFSEVQIYWFTATSTPCISTYKPIFIQSGLPKEILTTPSKYYDGSFIWWLHEKFHRKLQNSYKEHYDEIFNSIELLENNFQKEAEELRKKFILKECSEQDLMKLTNEAFLKSIASEESLYKKVRSRKSLNILFEMFWNKQNNEAMIKF
jgi:dipeptidase